MSLHLNGSNTFMKKLQLLFAFLAHTQVCLSSVQFPVCPLKHCSSWHCWVGVLNESFKHTCWWLLSCYLPTREQHFLQGVFWRVLGRRGLQPDPSKTAQSICAFCWTGKLRKWLWQERFMFKSCSRPGISNPAPGELPSCRLQFQPCWNTPVCNYQVDLNTLISWFRCVWLGLELKSSGW